MSIIKPFIDQYKWEEIDFSSYRKDWKMFELNNELISLRILYVPYHTEEIRHTYKPKHNLNWENYLAVKKLSASLRGMIKT